MYESVEHFGCLFDQVTLVILQLIIYRTMKPRVVTHIQHQTIVLRHYSNTVLGRCYSWSVWYPCFQPDFLTFSLHEKSPGMKLSLVPRPHQRGESLVTFGWFLGIHYKFTAYCMHSCEPIANLRAKKVLCHHVEVVKNFQCCTTDCIFCNVIGTCKIVCRKQSMLMKPEGLAGCHQTLSSWSGHKTIWG